jgi:hypothetical protein
MPQDKLDRSHDVSLDSSGMSGPHCGPYRTCLQGERYLLLQVAMSLAAVAPLIAVEVYCTEDTPVVSPSLLEPSFRLSLPRRRS